MAPPMGISMFAEVQPLLVSLSILGLVCLCLCAPLLGRSPDDTGMKWNLPGYAPPQKDVERLLKAIEKLECIPQSEEEFDTICDQLEEMCRSLHINPNVIPLTLLRRLPNDAIEDIRAVSVRSFERWRHGVAIILWPLSNQPTRLKNKVFSDFEPKGSVIESNREFDQLYRRFMLLCRRYTHVSEAQISRHDWLQLYLRLLPLDVAEAMRLRVEKDKEPKEWRNLASQIATMNRENLERRTTVSALIAASEQDDEGVLPLVAPVQQPYEARRCFRCQKLGHMVSQCPLPPPPMCNSCGERHNGSNCSRTYVAGTKDGPGYWYRNTRGGGIQIEIEAMAGKNKIDAINRTIRRETEKKRLLEESQAKHRDDRKALKILEAEAVSLANQGHGKPDEIYQQLRTAHRNQQKDPVAEDAAMEEVGCVAAAEDIHAAVDKAEPPLNVWVRTARAVELLMMVDTGASVNVLRPEDVARLPPSQRTSVKRSDLVVRSANGVARSSSEITLPIVVGRYTMDQVFIILPAAPVPILGMPFLRAAKLAVDPVNNRLMSTTDDCGFAPSIFVG